MTNGKKYTGKKMNADGKPDMHTAEPEFADNRANAERQHSPGVPIDQRMPDRILPCSLHADRAKYQDVLRRRKESKERPEAKPTQPPDCIRASLFRQFKYFH